MQWFRGGDGHKNSMFRQCLMKRISHLCVVAAAIVASAFTTTVGANAQSGFTVNGRPVSASTYQAYKLVNESISLMRENRAGDASVQLKRALQLDPTVPEARGMLGMALARLGKTDEAAEQMQIAITHNRSLVNARLNLAALYQSSGKTQDALDIYKQVLKDFPDSKIVNTIQDRVNLLENELHSRLIAHASAKSLDHADYLSNVVADGRKRWPAMHMPLRVYVYPGDSLVGWKDEYDTILRESFAEWQKVSDGKVQFTFVNSPRDADITCTWVDEPKLLESSAEGGEAQVQTMMQSVVKCHMLLSLNDGGSAFPFTDNLVRTLCLHEIGHALGLMGHSTRAKDVMYCSTPLVDREEHLSARDVATLNALYAADVDGLSAALARLEYETKGNALNILRLALIAASTLIAAIAFVVAIARRSSKKNRSVRKKNAMG
jgi:predicted Zn-dependent protease